MNILLFLFNTISGDYMNLNDIICKNLIVCDVNDDVSIISTKMRDYDIGFIPIIDRNKIVGVVTDRDIACRVFENNEIDADDSEFR